MTAESQPSPEDIAKAEGQAPEAGSTLARLFIEHNRSLQSFLRVRVGSQHDAEEIAQEAYARLLQLGRPGAIGYLRAYLFKIATHIAIDRARLSGTGSMLGAPCHVAGNLTAAGASRNLWCHSRNSVSRRPSRTAQRT
jgi:DNA-directed RNA polymerase specialized sigma24 family protein